MEKQTLRNPYTGELVTEPEKIKEIKKEFEEPKEKEIRKEDKK